MLMILITLFLIYFPLFETFSSLKIYQPSVSKIRFDPIYVFSPKNIQNNWQKKTLVSKNTTIR